MKAWILFLPLVILSLGVSQAQPPRGRPSEIHMPKGKTIEDLAEQYFDDPEVATEIRALNGLVAPQQAAPGFRLRLPGPEREQAVTALRVAAQAVEQARADGAKEFAPEHLKKAEESLMAATRAQSGAEYGACQRLADETWARARRARQESLTRRSGKNRFAVSVDDRGTTRVEVMEGDGVKVIAGKKSTTVKRGYAVRVKAGKEPEKAHAQLPAPRPVLPNHASLLVTSSIYFSWKRVEGATRYVLLISQDQQGLRPIRQLTTKNNSYLFRSTLADGDYFWFLRTVDSKGLVGQASSFRRFTLRTSTDGGLTVHPVPSGAGPEGD